MTKMTLIGAGNFGFALTYHLARKNDPSLQLTLYDHNPQTIAHIKKHHTHPKFFPLTVLPSNVTLKSDLTSAIKETEVIVLAMVSTALNDVLSQIKPHLPPKIHFVSVMKALDKKTGAPLSLLIEQALHPLPFGLSILAGGTTGLALTQEEYLGATLATIAPDAKKIQSLFASPYLQIQLSSDLLGVQYASSFKNLISVIIGLLAGLGFAYGTQTHALSLVASECEHLALDFGAQAQTFNLQSQCWGNDMIMSAIGQTRNQQLGQLLGEGLKFSQAVAQLKQENKTAESVNTLAVLGKIADLKNYPLLNFLEKLAREQAQVHQIVKIIENYSL